MTVLGSVLRLPESLYRGVVALRNRHYDRPGRGRRAGLPVVSVGNVTMGGTGKTPFVVWLARRVQEAGCTPAIVSRGYGGTAGKGPLLVSAGEGPLCPARTSGDEPQLLALTLDRAWVIVGSDRVAGAALAARQGADLAILDDGFQHRRVHRDLDIVLLDATNPFGNGRLLPAGSLREPVDALARADVVAITRSRAEDRFPEIEQSVRRHNKSAPIVGAGHRVVGFVDSGGALAAPPRLALAFCGIGSPDHFRRDLEAQGVALVELRAFRDHHRYTSAEIAGLRQRAEQRQAVLVTTEKDRARLGPEIAEQAGPGLLALRIETEVFRGQPLIEALHRVLEVGLGP
jgi:tetraacyldisaccharide 4'-kinase